MLQPTIYFVPIPESGFLQGVCLVLKHQPLQGDCLVRRLRLLLAASLDNRLHLLQVESSGNKLPLLPVAYLVNRLQQLLAAYLVRNLQLPQEVCLVLPLLRHLHFSTLLHQQPLVRPRITFWTKKRSIYIYLGIIIVHLVLFCFTLIFSV